MERTFIINYLVMLAASLIAISVPTSWAEPFPYARQSPKCQRLQQLCGNYGPYSCCPGLQCVGPPKGLGGGLCVPRLPTPLSQAATTAGLSQKPSRQCQKFGDACAPYGAYDCCEYGGLTCTYTPEVPGIGVCAPDGFPIMPLINALFGRPRKCQEAGQVCLNYGPYTCCKNKRLRCHVVEKAGGVGLCTPF